MNNTLFLKFREKLSNLEQREYIFALVSYHIAPTISGIKAGSIITLRNAEKNDLSLWLQYSTSFLYYYNIKCIEIKREEKEGIFLFYNEALLNAILSDEAVTKFLCNFAYTEKMKLHDKLRHLKNRFLSDCPHELGIFLGIPLEDVENFIEDPNKECLIVGYWKVYSNLSKAKQIFKAFEETKDVVMKSVIEGSVL